jgi:perosamine synthetase
MEFFSTTISDNSIKMVNETLISTMVSAGKKAELFEEKLNQKYGYPNPVSLNSGTVTMRLALITSNIGEGDEVILPAQTFIATGHVILQCGAKPVFADINLDGNISVESIKEKITEKTKAIIPVHWGGYPCDMDEINDLAKKHNLIVIEDAAHALGAKYKNKNIGTLSDFTSFSFQAIKHLTTGDGGLLTCKKEIDAKLIKRLRWFDIDRESSKTSLLGEREYDAINVGFKYHMNDLAAAIGLGNLTIIDEKLSYIKKIAKIYESELSDIKGLKLLNYKKDRESSYWLFPVFVEDRIKFIKKLKSENIPTSVVHLGIDKNTIFGDKIFEEDVQKIIKVIKSGW